MASIIITTTKYFATLLLLTTPILATAIPNERSEKFLPNLAVLLRGPDNSFGHSELLADVIRSQLNHGSFERGILADSILDKRSGATVQACATASCTDCHTIWDGSFTSNSGCISAVNTACLIISNLQDANIQYWNGAACNGASTIHSGCTNTAVLVGAPGTNSVGVHVNC